MKWYRLHWATYADGRPVGKPIYVWAANLTQARAACNRIAIRLTRAKYGLA